MVDFKLKSNSTSLSIITVKKRELVDNWKLTIKVQWAIYDPVVIIEKYTIILVLLTIVRL